MQKTRKTKYLVIYIKYYAYRVSKQNKISRLAGKSSLTLFYGGNVDFQYGVIPTKGNGMPFGFLKNILNH